MNKKILIIDDDENLLFGLGKILEKEGFKIFTSTDGSEGLFLIYKHMPDMIILDVGLPNMSGFDVKQMLSEIPEICEIPVIFLSARVEVESISKGFSLGSNGYITKPFHSKILISKINSVFKRVDNNAENKNILLETIREETIDATILGWIRALEIRMHDDTGHSKRVISKTMELAKLINFPENEMANLERGALLHDVGKIGVPDKILMKEGKLTPMEWELMRKHPIFSVHLIQSLKGVKLPIEIPLNHHENYDGSGYPVGKKGEEIPLAARIFSIIDNLDALLSDRPYRPALGKKEIITILRSERGIKFDPKILDVFLENSDSFFEGYAIKST
jgi:putative two-component system response regulator